MNKEDLINLLQVIPGNPEIFMSSGVEGECNGIDQKAYKNIVFRLSLEYYIRLSLYQKQKEKCDWSIQHTPENIVQLLDEYEKEVKWGNKPWVEDDDVDANRFERKEVYVLQPE
jgi:hypothetical protein